LRLILANESLQQDDDVGFTRWTSRMFAAADQYKVPRTSGQQRASRPVPEFDSCR
jgi:hypothetical protein